MSPPNHRWPLTQATGAEITQTSNLADRTTRGEAMKKCRGLINTGYTGETFRGQDGMDRNNQQGKSKMITTKESGTNNRWNQSLEAEGRECEESKLCTWTEGLVALDVNFKRL